MTKTTLHPALAPLLQYFFCQWLLNQRDVSPQTIASYRDTFRLLLRYLQDRCQQQPADLTLADLDAPRILGFLDYLESERRNCIRSRNVRLAAIRSFARYAATQEPAALPLIQRVLAIPMKRFERPLLGYLSALEVQSLLDAPDPSRRAGQRDRLLLTILYNTGARVSEAAALRVGDVVLGQSPTIRLRGKGRKERVVPLWRGTARQLQKWLHRIGTQPDSPLLPNARGQALSRAGIANRLKEAVRTTSARLPSLHDKRISPHTLRHSTAMHLLQAGVDTSVIAIWLGHENPHTTHMYIEADLAMKRRALDKLHIRQDRPRRYRPTDKLIEFLENL